MWWCPTSSVVDSTPKLALLAWAGYLTVSACSFCGAAPHTPHLILERHISIKVLWWVYQAVPASGGLSATARLYSPQSTSRAMMRPIPTDLLQFGHQCVHPWMIWFRYRNNT
jgi:hypothetical protein